MKTSGTNQYLADLGLPTESLSKNEKLKTKRNGGRGHGGVGVTPIPRRGWKNSLLCTKGETGPRAST